MITDNKGVEEAIRKTTQFCCIAEVGASYSVHTF